MVIFHSFLYVYQRVPSSVIQHGLLGNPPAIDDFPSYKPSIYKLGIPYHPSHEWPWTSVEPHGDLGIPSSICVYIYMYMYMYICSHPFIQFYTCTSRIFDCHLWLPSSYSHFSSFKSSFGVAMLDQRNRSWTGASLTVGCSPWLLKFDGIKMDQDGWLGVQHAPTILANLETARINCWTFSTPNFAWADDRRWLQCMFSDVAESFWTYWPTANSAAVDIYGDQGWFSQATNESNERTMVWIGS